LPGKLDIVTRHGNASCAAAEFVNDIEKSRSHVHVWI
jgi:hypothetical protein